MKISMKQVQTLFLSDAFSLFLKHCKVKNLSPQTIKSYQSLCKPFLNWYTGNIRDITISTIDDFILYLRENTKANDISFNTYVRNTKAFLYWCMECGYIEPFHITIHKADKKIKETYTEDELRRLLTKPDKKKCSFTEFKVWSFENYLLGTGNRISTALSVQIKDIDFSNNCIVLRHTKNRRQQIIPLSHSLSNVLREYLTIRGGSDDDYLFCDDNGQQAMRSGYISLVRRYNEKRSVFKHSCHLFRATYAKMAIMNGIDAFRLQQLMGHADISTTKNYVQMFSTDLQQDYDRYNPLDTLISNGAKIKMK